MQRIELLIIDPQNDFCHPGGSLFVPGADKDSVRLADMIDRISDKIYDVHVTLDTHHWYDIAHPGFWVNSDGKNPDPFTLISVDDVRNGVWRAVDPRINQQGVALDYVETLASNKRYMLCIWPPHCLIGQPGHNVVDPIRDALNRWEQGNVAMVDFVTKGSNYLTEHYSAVQADVPDSSDPTTMLNTQLIQTLESADVILLSGQALSHCLANTVRDIANNFGSGSVNKMVLLEDTTSSVPGFENLGTGFIKDLTALGMQISNSVDFLS